MDLDFIPILIGGFILFAITAFVIKMPGRSLQRKFQKLGRLKGTHKDIILAAVGNPNAVSSMADGRTLCQWQATGYHIALIFNGPICEGVTHEYAAR